MSRFSSVKFTVEVPVDHELDGAPSAAIIMEQMQRLVSSAHPTHNFTAAESDTWTYKLTAGEQAALDQETADALAAQAALVEPDNHVEAKPANDKK